MSGFEVGDLGVGDRTLFDADAGALILRGQKGAAVVLCTTESAGGREGDKAGEIFSRPATRQLLTALKGLKNGAVGAEETSPEVQAPRRSKREFQSQLDRIERVQNFINPAPLPADYEPLDLVA